jgi:hypothetical protein
MPKMNVWNGTAHKEEYHLCTRVSFKSIYVHICMYICISEKIYNFG